MKLGALKAAIRDLDGAPHMYVNVHGVVPLHVDMTKGSVLKALDEAFPGGRTQETGLKLVDGYFTRET